MKYFDELKRSMNFLAKDSRTVFLGQAVSVAGTAMSNTLKEVPSATQQAWYEYYSIFHWQPLVNGYSSVWPVGLEAVMAMARALPAPRALENLVECTGVRWIVVHAARTSPEERDAHLRRVRDTAPEGSRFLIEVPNGDVWLLPPPETTELGLHIFLHIVRRWQDFEKVALPVAVGPGTGSSHSDRSGTKVARAVKAEKEP